ncbi:response regulator receiver modulated diguanylate cyclase [endosymbiont of Acanthamoeba sp. UWC8]|uniref:PleD family two-component system response regulator n=1 Tax=endosymbiont of Acanthamoeba sp. UWC8 TaxID=86106 RepID=UPI0004D1A838|nr:PleD family two-component system response regulator [endosymbiont of Acanthamoeba sp. UWC8]AIF81088.1 response regulator receiver modulated diguanylate cyclase [endosymbiont of Acanthamoeba sp. UWC8]
MTAKILVVDDIVFNVKLLETKLKQEYYEVFVANNGVEAVKKAKELNPDIILMDVMMPEMDGIEATKIIKNDPNTMHIPIIIVTALNAQEDKVNGLSAGADDFLTKPINDHALITRIKSLLRLKFMMDELRARHVTSNQLGVGEEIIIDESNKIEGAKVILVDDDVAQAKKIKEKLNSAGISVDIVTEEQETLSLAEKNNYGLFIISTQLIDSDGLRLCSHIKNHDKLRGIPILIIVEEADEKTLTKGLEMGVNDYLLYPVESNELLARTSTQIKRKNYQDALRENYIHNLSLSVIDQLTNLYNRRYFDIHIKNLVTNAASTGKSLSLIMLDIDHFKNINDTYGHQAGDIIIQEVARRILLGVRPTDLSARYGGEEFVVILPDTKLEDAIKVSERIRQSVEMYPLTTVDSSEIKCTISLGVSALSSDDSPENLLKRADQCLYKAKEGGRNRVVAEEAFFT